MSRFSSIYPADYICPVFRHGSKPYFLGTGFFLDKPASFLTCAHVVSGNEENLAVVHPPTGKAYKANVIKIDNEIDLAQLQVDRYQPPVSVHLSSEPSNTLDFVHCYDYSTVRGFRAGKIRLNPATRIGNVTRLLNRDEGDARFDQALELSFPILQGASGAPILGPRGDYLSLLGVAFGNLEYEARPVSIHEVLDERNKIYERKQYMLPLGLAINGSHVARFVDTNSA
ncbi:MAG TPA: serine protease [Rudaea sp.]|nr:serine protease [Rudaea sp.]